MTDPSAAPTLSATDRLALGPRGNDAVRAVRAKYATDVTLPRIPAWNYGPCQFHTTPAPDCSMRLCGGELYAHQRIGAAWMLAARKGILADCTGAGKTAQALAAYALLRMGTKSDRPAADFGLDPQRPRMLVICQASAVRQWVSECKRWLPGHFAVEVSGPPAHRARTWADDSWDIAVVSAATFRNDEPHLRPVPRTPRFLVIDDVDPLLAHANATHKALVRYAADCSHVFVLNATCVQTALEQLHAAFVPCDGHALLGSRTAFERQFLRRQRVNGYARGGRQFSRMETVGVRNIDLLRERVDPFYLRRTYDDLGSDVPDVTVQHVWLELSPEQRRAYTDVRNGALRLSGRPDVSLPDALSIVLRAQQVASGLAALEAQGGTDISAKADWVIDHITTEWSGEKVVVYTRWRGMVRAIMARLEREGIGAVAIWGEESDPSARQAAIGKFWDDPDCRVMVGTAAMERSLNLQAAGVLVTVDLLTNPARFTQLVGRIRRQGSRHSHVQVVQLLSEDTFDARFLDYLNERAAVADVMHDESSDLFDSLSPLQLLRLVT